MKMLEDGEDPFVPAPHWKPARIKTEKSELEELKSLIRVFLKEIDNVPFRAVDCDQKTVRGLLVRLKRAIQPSKSENL